MRPVALAASVSCIAAAVTFACSEGELLQGDVLVPDTPVRPAPVRDRPDGSCEGGACDAGDAAPDAPRIEVEDGAVLPSNTCETARALGTLAGDQGAPSIEASGGCSEWLSVRVTEGNSGALGAGMKLRVTLTPNGHDLDLYGFVSPDRDQRACGAPTAASNERGTQAVDVVSLAWGEGTVANGADDSRTVSLLVQAPTNCRADGGFRLRVEGNK